MRRGQMLQALQLYLRHREVRPVMEKHGEGADEGKKCALKLLFCVQPTAVPITALSDVGDELEVFLKPVSKFISSEEVRQRWSDWITHSNGVRAISSITLSLFFASIFPTFLVVLTFRVLFVPQLARHSLFLACSTRPTRLRQSHYG